ncbi:hypothetical protein [Streptomyces antibioticus]|uniref:hypothetical protein n=1 Tax=Streptomyces antibioticus TaxID=1890 RepID=UPI003D715B35
MSNILRIELTDDQRGELHILLARRDLTRSTRLRAECIRFHDGGIEALPDAPRLGRPAKVLGGADRAALAEVLDRSAAAGVTWTVPALREWLRE